jgi:hypothetical protein
VVNYYGDLLSSRTSQFGAPSTLQENPNAQAAAAVAIEQEQGLSAWTTYSSGAYQAYLNNGTTPDTSVSGGTGTASSAPATTTGFLQPEALPSTCLIGMPGFDLGVGSTPDICFVQKSWLRALLGGGLVIAGGLVGMVGLNLLFKSGFGVSLPAGQALQNGANTLYGKARPGAGPAIPNEPGPAPSSGSQQASVPVKVKPSTNSAVPAAAGSAGKGLSKKAALPAALTKQVGPGSGAPKKESPVKKATDKANARLSKAIEIVAAA